MDAEVLCGDVRSSVSRDDQTIHSGVSREGEAVTGSLSSCPLNRTGLPAPFVNTISAIILAGGRSSRMGTDKALLPLPGEQDVTFVERLTSLLASHCQEVLLVVRDAAQAIDYAIVEPRGARILTDETPDYGPLMGLYSGLRAIHPSSTHALLVAVDMPCVQAALISFMLSQHPGDALLVPLVEHVPQVLLAVYPRAALPRIEACLREGRRDPRSLLAVCPVHYLEEAQLRAVDPLLRSFVNINTPEDLQRGFSNRAVSPSDFRQEDMGRSHEQ